MRKDYEPSALARSDKSAPELASRVAFSRERPPVEGLVAAHRASVRQDK